MVIINILTAKCRIHVLRMPYMFNTIDNESDAFLNNSTLTTNQSINMTLDEYLTGKLGPQRLNFDILVPITLVYGIIFVSGLIGNVCTCLVITGNKHMHTATNYYLFNLAVADLLTLILGKQSILFHTQ